MISRRAQLVDASGIRKVFDLAAKLKNPINLSIGQPDFDVPEEFKQKVIKAVKDGKNKYTVTQGIQELRDEIRSFLINRRVNVDDIFISSGVSGGILLSLLAVTDPGDEIIVSDPYFVMYKHLAGLLGLKIKYVDTYPDFKFTAERLDAVISERTKLVFINSPSNPTGCVLNSRELKDLGEVLNKFSPVAIFDEIYSEFDYEKEHGCLSEFYERTVILNGFSKSHAMTGWRIGYAAGPKDIIEQMIKIQQYTFVCSPSIIQYGALGAINGFLNDILKEYRKKRDIVFELLKDKFDVMKPQGAFYIFPKAPDGDGEGFVSRAIKNNVLIIPGSIFSEKDTHFRISFASSLDTIKEGCKILNKLV